MKKFLSLVLALVMTMSLVTVSAGAKDFTDSSKIQYAEAAEPAPSGRSRGPYRRVLLPGGGRGPAGGPVRRGDGLPRRPRHRRPEGAGGASEPAPRPVYGAAAAHGRPGRAPPHRQAVRPAAPEKAP